MCPSNHASHALKKCHQACVHVVKRSPRSHLSGCATGLVTGWSGGPQAALQSCIGIGLISSIVDFGGGSDPAARAAPCCSGCHLGLGCSPSQAGHHHHADGAALPDMHAHRGGVDAIRAPMQHDEERIAMRRGQALGGRTKSGQGVHFRKEGSDLSSCRLPPVMWLGVVCASASIGYFDPAADWEDGAMMLKS